MSDVPSRAPKGCLSDEEVAQVRDGAPGEVPDRLAQHLAQCERCQERALFGSEGRKKRRGSKAAVLPTPQRALVLLGILLLVMIAFFFTLNLLVAPPR